MIRQLYDFVYFCLLQPMVYVVIYEPTISILHCDLNIGYKNTTNIIVCGNQTHDHAVKPTSSTKKANKVTKKY